MIQKIAIAGAGISGMSTAYVLQKKGYEVTVFARAFSPLITSNKAAAFWFPYHIRNDKRGVDWCTTSYRYYQDFMKDPSTGISMHQLLKVLRQGEEEEEPIWKEFMPAGSFGEVEPPELPSGVARMYDVQVPLIETQLFLPWLHDRLREAGVQFIQTNLDGFEQLSEDFDLVINCTALGSRELCGDETLVPVRGQVGLLAPGPKLPIYLDNEMPLYVVPRKDAIIVGGTYEPHELNEQTEPPTIERILNNAYQVFPELKQQSVIGSWAGLRPYRPDIRLEREQGTNIIHNYGHGGSGFTLAFGCAEGVGKLVDEGLLKRVV
ncbi:MAG: FAD-dependent oxidoreductase [Ferruginibacter sp.]|nr:FAD-dependent oxidoreductase [Ferruginibacter sp.]